MGRPRLSIAESLIETLILFRATIETRLTVSEIIAKVRSRTYEADPNKSWWQVDVGTSRWIGWVIAEKFMLRRLYPTERLIESRFRGLYSQIGFNGEILSKGSVRQIAFSALFRPKTLLTHGPVFVLYFVLCLLGIILGDMHVRLFSMLLLGVFAFIVRYLWWGYKVCAREELRFLSDILDATDATNEAVPTDRH